MNISKHLAEHAVGELMQMGYTVDGDTLTPPEKLSDFACKFFGVAALAAPADALAEPVAWMVWWGIGDMRPSWPPFNTREEAEDHASAIKSATEVRPIYTAPPATQLQQAVARALEELKFHPQASHVEPNYRDWFNKTIDAAIRAKGQQ